VVVAKEKNKFGWRSTGNQAGFDQQVLDAAKDKGKVIANAASFEDCNHDVTLDTSCTFDGYINWPLYVGGYALYGACQ
jgi:hypothetical protein